MNQLEKMRDEVVLLHEQIQAWFRGEADDAALDELMACFTKDFRMVAARGQSVEGDGVRNIFASLRGARDGLVIAIHDVQVLVEAGDGCLVSYREDQTLPDGSGNQRHSVTWLDTSAPGRPRWRFLQETLLPA